MACALTFLGVIMVFSATGVYASTEYNNSFFFLQKELVWLFLGFSGLFVGYSLNLRILQKYSFWVYLLFLVLVILTHTPLGAKIGGAQRWLRIGFFNLQPSEFMKIALVCMMASYLGGRPDVAGDFRKGFLFCLVLIGISVAPVLTQPDFGTSLMIAAVGCLLMFVAGARLKYLFTLSLVSVPFIYYAIVLFPYRVRRVLAFLDPWSDPQGKGFQIVQSFLAIGRGNMTGVGLGESTQKLFYLPAAHTDFIFSILAEELGFAGCTCVIAGFAILAVTGFTIAMRSKNLFDSLVALGCTAHITFQAIFNIAVVTGSVPTKGIPLPFISFGGSNLILNLFAVGLIMNVSRQREKDADEKLRKAEIERPKPYRLVSQKERYSKPAWI